ncbi:hypothetical protein C2845_PM17G15170 [Panicum miliaceum]|uniref:R13L1/DRL21-like LRR repeat region domain-containing protein n=1 Tax=Panicum miliaceum TaxID=4540 RepID=A0A3L6Q728_PANMI|nr:hypothetical protein C2845_PM17G15170 [Panicum miliaceum]
MEQIEVVPIRPHLQRIVVGTDHLRDVGMKIIRKCGGLPLAVKVMGGLLSTKPQNEGDWEAVLHHRAWSVDGLPEELDKRIYLSYEDLSPQLKQCFLYCSLFPKVEAPKIPWHRGSKCIYTARRHPLQHIVLRNVSLGSLPSSIIKLMHLRTLNMNGLKASVLIPKGFGGLTNLRRLYGFPVHMDMDGSSRWCSLEEIGPLSQLRKLTLHGLENVPASPLAETARISSKEHLDYLELHWSSSGWTELIRDEMEKQQWQHATEEASSSLTAVGGGGTAVTSAAFPNLTHLALEGLCEWEGWDWDVTAGTMGMPALEALTIQKCKLSRLPPGLANNKRHALRRLNLHEVANLASVDNIPSVVELDVLDCPKLKRISGLARLHKIRIMCCPNLEVLEGVPLLDSLVLEDAALEALPGYLQAVNASKKLYKSIPSGSSSERDKINHIAKCDVDCFEDSEEA